ncbi:hypothetical protein ACQVQT_12425 [Bacillus paranthracis]|uniref:Helix-turn-helix domain protein n=7 Tax=Bacillaceae TaxID=186817 RepID=A0A5M9GUD9_9BACI|nr:MULTISPECIES: hypothetical protein [Bacillus cereus group]ACJ81543.1 hypothetical Membrane Spanning Protein [Bacillus cereus AH187]EDZ57625.1 hypothetical Membrane Spanning Protein [Bacillus cereus H3081.97]EJP98045.1 hypothetical protein IAU_01317 [Bacillus cereus IS075]EJR20364.1 hypothetical protein II7_00789 [Bacillus cereus MSX-A12]EOO89163.1 hypothetical protein IGS_02946 [Bacillus cereus IS845/00]EOO96983.1 hypothetical protein IGQ_02698 [Bacillus cereus IS195]MRA59825.1 hypothetic
MKQEWITKSEVIKCGKYGKISKHMGGFKHWLKEGHLSTKEGRGSNGKPSTFFNVNELDNLMTKIEEMEEKYLTEKEAVYSFGIKETVTGNSVAGRKRIGEIIALCDVEKIDYRYYENGFNKAFLYVDKEQLLHFFDTHIKNDELAEKYNISHLQFDIVDRQNDLKRIRFTKMMWFYRIEDVKYFEMFNTNLDDYYTLEEIYNILGIKKHTLLSIAKEEGIKPVKLSSKKVYYSKKAIKGITENVKESKEKYCLASEINNICGVDIRQPTAVFTPIKTNAIIRYAFGTSAEFVFRLEEVQEYKDKIDMQDKIKRILSEKTPVEAFEEWLILKEISFSKNSRYTEQEWYSYCKEKFVLSERNERGIRNLLRDYVDCTEYLSNLTIEKELYSLTSNEINLKLFNPSIGVKKQGFLYAFLREFHSRVTIYLNKKEARKKTFDINRITNPYQYEVEEKPKEVYEYEEYIKVYDYVQKEEHKHKAILDAEKIIADKDKKEIFYYGSAWLYVLIHLGNAWRHGDVMDIAMVDFESIGINSLEILKSRDLTKEEANAVINQIKRKDLTVNKTGATNRFNCPDDLAVSLATAIIICSIIAKKRTSLVISSNSNETRIIDFGTQDDSSFGKKAHNAFFENFEIDGFQFQSRQMNRTVLVLIYMVLVKKGKGSAALEMAQRLRAHENFETTNIYLVIPQDELDELSEGLFNRKNFGYIPDLMAEILIGDTEDRNQRTQEILALSATFGGIHKLEATSGFINKTLAERQKVADQIFNMGLDEVTDLMFDLQVNSLPSNEENFQCLVSPNCQKPHLDSCKDCPFAIPNFYAVSSLVEGFKTSIFEFVKDFDPNTFDGEKTRLMNVLYKDLDHVERAMQKFGEEEVFHFFERGKEEYNELVDLIGEVQTKTGEDFEAYLTYNPIYLS